MSGNTVTTKAGHLTCGVVFSILLRMQTSSLSSRIRGAFLHVPLLLLLVMLFGRTLFTDRAIEAPDSPVDGMPTRGVSALIEHYSGMWRANILGDIENPVAPIPRTLLLTVLDKRPYQVAAYAADVLLLYLAMLFLLRGKGVARLPAAAGALAMAFAGHTFTIIAAGHMSKFGMMPFAVFTLGCLDRAITRRSLLYYALTGLCAGLGISEHQDIMAMFCLLASFYGLFKLIASFDKASLSTFIWKNAAGVLIAGVVFAGIALPSLIGAKSAVEGRDVLTGDSPERKWDFATSWSLPRADLVEFMAPCVYGTQTGDPEAPYWGSLGRSSDWQQGTQGSMLNLRQHSVYLGALQMLFALFALALVFRKRDPAAGPVPGHRKAETVFWAVAWVVCVFLALGRFGPLDAVFYKMFYALPYASGIRCPVKFLHLVEVATVILFAFGFDGFLSRNRASRLAPAKQAKKGADQKKPVLSGVNDLFMARAGFAFAAVGGTLGIVFLAASAWVAGKPALLIRQWESIGLSQYRDLFSGQMSNSLVHAGLLCIFAAALFLFGRSRSISPARIGFLRLALLVVLSLDLLSVAWRFVKTVDMESVYTTNPMIDLLRGEKKQEPFRVAAPVKDGVCNLWMRNVLPYYGIEQFDISVSSGMPADYKAFFSAIGDNPFRLWQLTDTRFLLGPAQKLTPLIGQGGIASAMAVQLGRSPSGGIEAMTVPVDRASHVLLANHGALPRALLYYSWEKLNDGEDLARLADRSWNPFASVIVSRKQAESVGLGFGRPESVPDRAKVLRYDTSEASFEVDAKTDGVLLLNDRFDPSWSVTVDGKPEVVLKCNYIMRGVKVPAGLHTIRFVFNSPYAGSVMVRFVVLITILLWWLFSGIARTRAGRPSVGATT